MKILVVDDEPVSREMLARMVAASPGHQVTTAEGGETAWRLLDDPSRSFDVVFLDLQMPKTDGFELLRRMRESVLLKNIEVVVCTASKDRESVTRAVQLGARHYIVKPITPAIVAAKLQQFRKAEPAVVERKFGGS